MATTHHVDIEIIGVMNSNLIVRFRIGDKHWDTFVGWDGTGDIFDTLKFMARGVVREIIKPPVATEEQLRTQIGRQGHIDVEPPPPMVFAPVPPPPAE